MNLLSLFKKTDWSKLKDHSNVVQQDIAYLIAFDFLIKSTINNRIQKLVNEVTCNSDEYSNQLAQSLTKMKLVSEFELAVLSTGLGKLFNDINWSKVAPDSVVKLIGILAMCEFRNNEQLTIENDIIKSGYSSVSDEARSQFLILLANDANIKDLNTLRIFDRKYFSNFWLDTRHFLYDQLQHNICAESKGLTPVVRERFDKLSKSRKEILLMLADSLAKKNINNVVQKANASKPVAKPVKTVKPFNAEQYKIDHPYLFIPYKKVIQLMYDCVNDVMGGLNTIDVNTYDLRRLSGLKDDVPDLMLNMIVLFDANVLAYCALVSVVQDNEPKFVGCGVWKAVSEEFQSTNMAAFSLMTGFKKNGMLNTAAINPAMLNDSTSSGLDLLTIIRKSPNNFLNSNGDLLQRQRILTQGTVLFVNMLNHPTYGESLAVLINSLFKKITDSMEELSKGDLLDWEQQKNLK